LDKLDGGSKNPLQNALRKRLQAEKQIREAKHMVAKALLPEKNKEMVTPKVPGFPTVELITGKYTVFQAKIDVFMRWLRVDFGFDFVDQRVTSDKKMHAMFDSYFQHAWNDGKLSYSYYYDHECFEFEGKQWLRYWSEEDTPCYRFTTDMRLSHLKPATTWGKETKAMKYEEHMFDPRIFTSIRVNVGQHFLKQQGNALAKLTQLKKEEEEARKKEEEGKSEVQKMFSTRAESPSSTPTTSRAGARRGSIFDDIQSSPTEEKDPSPNPSKIPKSAKRRGGGKKSSNISAIDAARLIKIEGDLDWQHLHLLLAQDLCEPFTKVDCRVLIDELVNNVKLDDMDFGAASSSSSADKNSVVDFDTFFEWYCFYLSQHKPDTKAQQKLRGKLKSQKERQEFLLHAANNVASKGQAITSKSNAVYQEHKKQVERIGASPEMLRWLDEGFDKQHVAKVLKLGFIDTDEKRRSYLTDAQLEAERKQKIARQERREKKIEALEKRSVRWKQLKSSVNNVVGSSGKNKKGKEEGVSMEERMRLQLMHDLQNA